MGSTGAHTSLLAPAGGVSLAAAGGVDVHGSALAQLEAQGALGVAAGQRSVSCDPPSILITSRATMT